MFHIPIISPVLRNVMRIVSAVVFLLTILSAFGGKINPQYFAIPSVFTLALPYFAILTGIIALFWLCTGRFIFAALAAGTIVLCAGPLKQAFPLNFAKQHEENRLKFTLMSYNILHTDDMRNPDSKTNRAVEYLLHSGVDVICMAELRNFSPKELRKASPMLIDSLIKAYPFRAGLSSTDIKIMSKYPVDRMGITDADTQTRFDMFNVHFPGGHNLRVAMVHLPSYNLTEEERRVVSDMKSVDGAKQSVKELKGSILQKLRNSFRERARMAEKLRAAIDTVTGPLIVCGDFNDVPASWTYNIIMGDDMHDAYTETNFGPTWTYNAHFFYFHIDQMLYRGPLKALKVRKGKINTSDHYPLIGEFEFTE